MDSIFSNKEVMALRLFNNTCVDLRGEYDKSAKGLMKIWESTLNIVSSKFTNNTLKLLLSAMLKRTPHWEKDISKLDTTFEKLLFYFRKCSTSLDFLSVGEYYGFSLSSYQGSNPSTVGYCLVHPNRKSRRDFPICNSCFTKLNKLNLLEYPIDYGLLYVLKIRKQYGKGPQFCVNHSTKLALGNGLCGRCNTQIGKLGEELDKAEIFVKVKI